MLSGAIFGPKGVWECYKVDASKVAGVKAKSVENATRNGIDSVNFVSTNDVITSHFCRASGARVCMMVVNFRDKTDLGIGDNHAGCYEGCLLLDEEKEEKVHCKT